jgi:hypothetical protein
MSNIPVHRPCSLVEYTSLVVIYEYLQTYSAHAVHCISNDHAIFFSTKNRTVGFCRVYCLTFACQCNIRTRCSVLVGMGIVTRVMVCWVHGRGTHSPLLKSPIRKVCTSLVN